MTDGWSRLLHKGAEVGPVKVFDFEMRQLGSVHFFQCISCLFVRLSVCCWAVCLPACLSHLQYLWQAWIGNSALVWHVEIWLDLCGWYHTHSRRAHTDSQKEITHTGAAALRSLFIHKTALKGGSQWKLTVCDAPPCWFTVAKPVKPSVLSRQFYKDNGVKFNTLICSNLGSNHMATHF